MVYTINKQQKSPPEIPPRTGFKKPFSIFLDLRYVSWVVLLVQKQSQVEFTPCQTEELISRFIFWGNIKFTFQIKCMKMVLRKKSRLFQSPESWVSRFCALWHHHVKERQLNDWYCGHWEPVQTSVCFGMYAVLCITSSLSLDWRKIFLNWASISLPPPPLILTGSVEFNPRSKKICVLWKCFTKQYCLLSWVEDIPVPPLFSSSFSFPLCYTDLHDAESLCWELLWSSPVVILRSFFSLISNH